MADFVLYHTVGCHLCDIAQSIIDPIMSEFDHQCHLVDIAEDVNLLEEYGWLIPVFKHKGAIDYLKWPFSDVDVKEYIANVR